MPNSRTDSGRVAALLTLLFIPLAACGSDDPVGIPGPEDVTFGAATGVVLSQMTELESGVYIQTLVGGEGEALTSGMSGLFDYTLRLSDGTLIENGEDFAYTHEVSGVIPGFRDGVHRMLEGETRLIVIPSDQAYGRNPPPGIPANAILVFRITLTSIGG